MGEERWVGESDDDFSWCWDFNRWRCCCNGLWPISWSKPSALYRHLPTTLSLVTHHFVLHNPLWLVASHSAESIDDSYDSSHNIPNKTYKPSHVLKRVTCMKPMTHSVSHVPKTLHHVTSQSWVIKQSTNHNITMTRGCVVMWELWVKWCHSVKSNIPYDS